MNQKRGFIQIPILIAIMIAVVLGGGYVAYRTAKHPQSTSPKKTAIEPQATVIVSASTTAKIEDKKSEPAKDQGNSLIDSLEKKIADLTQKVNQPSEQKVEAPKTSIFTLPSGAVVEMDANGNIIRTIKEAPQQIYADVCNNIEGIQSYTPSGMTRDASGNCIVSPAPTPASAPTSASEPTPVPAVTEASVSSLTFTVSGAMVNGREEFGVEVEDGGIVYKQYGVPVVLAWTVQARGVDAFFHCSIGDDGGSVGVASQGTRNAVIGTNIIKCIGFGFDQSSTPTGTILKKSVQVKVQ